MDFQSLLPDLPWILQGVWVTLGIVVVSMLLGLVLGMVLSLMRLSNNRFFDWFASVYVSIFRGTPLVVQLMILYYLLPMWGIMLSKEVSAVLALGLNSGAYMSEIIRAGIQAVDKGQTEAAMALGIPYRTTMRSIIIPQATKNILPAIINELTALTKESAIVTVIGAQDLMRRASQVGMRNFRVFEPLLLAAAVYYILVMLISYIGKLVERRLAKSDQS